VGFLGDMIASMGAGATVLAQAAPGAVALGLAGAAAPAAAQEYVEIQCYSEPGQQNSCPLPPRTQAVTFKGPDRSMRCREGQTWRKRGNSLWVANGCGGIFEASVRGTGGGNPGWGGGGGNPGWGGGNQPGGEITCRSQNNREQRCAVNTGGRASLVRQMSGSPCIEGQSWRYDNNSITVRNGCQGVFAYGTAAGGGGWGGGGPGWGGGGWGNQGFAGEIRCGSQNMRPNSCRVNTANRVQLVEQLSRSQCVQGQTWGYDRNRIWVNQGCEARFAYGQGNFQPQAHSGNQGGGGGGGSGVAAGLLGAGLAAGLVALVNSGKKQAPSSPGAASSLAADYGLFPAGAQAEAKACMAESARQLGATGASQVRLNNVVSSQRSGSGWRLVSDVTGTWPNESSRLRVDCTATADRVTGFDINAL
jgi:hypothetical protein